MDGNKPLTTKAQPVAGIKDWFSFMKLIEFFRGVDWSVLVSFPTSLKDGAALRKWLGAVLDLCDTVTEATPTTVDDETALLFRALLEDDESWAAFHNLLVSMFVAEERDDEVAFAARGQECKALGEKVGIDPITIMTIISTIIALFKMWRDRK